jgi:hypothetical protein
MSVIKVIIFTLILTFVCSTGFNVIAQESTSVLQQSTVTTEDVSQSTDNTEVKEKKKDKKKVRINETFYFNFLIDLLTVFIIVVLIHFRNYHRKDTLFTYFLFNIAIFLLTFLLNEIKISMGAAFGLFAVFSMLRYRTEGISTKDMTYLFIVIAIGLMSAIKLEYYELGIINGILIVATFVLDGNIIMKREYSKKLRYEKIEMIKPQNHEALMEDLRERTGINVHRFVIKRVDFLRDIANIVIYYYNNDDKANKK